MGSAWLCLLLAGTAYAAKNHFASSPFDNFRIECPKGAGATGLGVKMVESVGAARQDVVFDLSCDDVNEIYPWINMPGGVKSVEREDCYYSKMFDPIIDDDIDLSCRAREYVAGITRISETRIQVLCCRLRSRDEFNCGELTFNKPLGLTRSSIIENENMLINGLSIQGMTYKVRFCDLSPRSIDAIMEDVPPNRRKIVRIATTKAPATYAPATNPYLRHTSPSTTTSSTVPPTTTPRFIQTEAPQFSPASYETEDTPTPKPEELEPLTDADLLSISSELEYENPIDGNSVPRARARGVAQVRTKAVVSADGVLKASSFSIDEPTGVFDKKPVVDVIPSTTTTSTTEAKEAVEDKEDTAAESTEASEEVVEEETTTTPAPTTTVATTTTTQTTTTTSTTTTTPAPTTTTTAEPTTTEEPTTPEPSFTPNFAGAGLLEAEVKEAQTAASPAPIVEPHPLIVPNPKHILPVKATTRVTDADAKSPQMNEEINRLIKRIQDAQSEREQVALFQQSISTLLSKDDLAPKAPELPTPLDGNDRLTIANLDFPQKPTRNQQMSLRGNRISKADLPLRSSAQETRAHADASYLLLKSVDDQRRAPIRNAVHPYVRGAKLDDDKKEVSKDGEIVPSPKPKGNWRIQIGTSPEPAPAPAPTPVPIFPARLVVPKLAPKIAAPKVVMPMVPRTTTRTTTTRTTTTTTTEKPKPADPLLFKQRVVLSSQDLDRIADQADYVDPDSDVERPRGLQQRRDISGKTHESSNRKYRVKHKKADNALLIDEDTRISPFEESLTPGKAGRRALPPLPPLRVFKKDKKMKAEIKAMLNAGRFASKTTKTTEAPAVSTTQAASSTAAPTTTAATTVSEAPKTTTVAPGTPAVPATTTVEAKSTTVLPEKSTVKSVDASGESGEIAQDAELSMELPEMAVAEVDEETLANSLSKNIRRAPARYSRLQPEMLDDKQTDDTPAMGESIDGPVVSIEKTARRMAKMMKMEKDAVKTHLPVDGEAMLMSGMLPMTTAPLLPAVAPVTSGGAIRDEKDLTTLAVSLLDDEDDDTPAGSQELTTAVPSPTTTEYDSDKFFVTRKPIPYVWRPKVLTFCTKEDAVRDTDGMVVACGGELEWDPPRCPTGTECFHADDSIYMICCPVARG